MAQLHTEISLLRKQLEILNRNNKNPQISPGDRFFFLIMKNFLLRWKENLVIIKPKTVIQWHRKRFSEYLFEERVKMMLEDQGFQLSKLTS